MKHVVHECPGVEYIGADIVARIIKANTAQHGNELIRFFHADLTQAEFPKTDLMICRDCLSRLSYQDINLVLNNFVVAGIPLLLTSTHLGAVANHDIGSGDFRVIDLFSTPFNFSKDALYRSKIGCRRSRQGKCASGAAIRCSQRYHFLAEEVRSPHHEGCGVAGGAHHARTQARPPLKKIGKAELQFFRGDFEVASVATPGDCMICRSRSSRGLPLIRRLRPMCSAVPSRDWQPDRHDLPDSSLATTNPW